ncbi:MAG: tRNA (guanosine(37)-N1)-methyltransferase TrmD [Bacteroidota bacterium]
MRIDVITCLPQLLASPFSHSIVKKAIHLEKVDVHIHDLRTYATNKHRKVDDYVYGGGAGMLLMAEPIVRCVEALQAQHPFQELIYMAPDGELLTQSLANELACLEHLVILCGHYKGIDERVRERYITREISIGDYVLSGGELAAAVLVDAIVRLLPGALSDETSALTDSFQDHLIAPPAYTRPANFRGMTVPKVLLSGDTQAIQAWRHEQSIKRTEERRPNLCIEGRGNYPA